MSNNNTPSKVEALEALDSLFLATDEDGRASEAYKVVRAFISGAPDAANAGEPASKAELINAHVKALAERQPCPCFDKDGVRISPCFREAATDEGFARIMAMSEAEIDAELRALGIDPETAARKAGEAVAEGFARAKCRGYVCRLCGKDAPHQHTPEEIIIFRNGVKFARGVAADESTRAPDGRKLVPLEPTQHMLERALYANERGDLQIREARAIYAAMLEAAPPSGEVRLNESNQVDELRSPQRPSAPAPEGDKQ